MKVIDLINMMNNKEELPERMIINKRIFHSNVFKSMIYEEDCNTDIWMAIKLQHIGLDDTVKLIEDEIDIDSIEELQEIVEYFTERNTINQLIEAVKQLKKEVKELKEEMYNENDNL